MANKDLQIKALTRPLTMDEIDIRVKTISKDGNWGIMLAYKNARVDMARFDEAFGIMGWSRHHEVQEGVLTCGVTAGGISKWDTGQDDNKSGHKAWASDAFKRVGFNFGIGRGLYNYPLIIVQLQPKEVYQSGGSFKASKKLRPSDWTWVQVLDDHGGVISLRATDKNEIERFNYRRN